jgi:DNA-binding beta-propeller fold protein YncE
VNREELAGGDCRDFGYVADDRWAKLPTGFGWREVAAVATDARDRVYVFGRGDHPVAVFESDGTFLRSWGEGLFVRPHGLTVGPDDSIYCTDDQGHVVDKFTTEGRLLFTLGTRGQPSDTGATSVDFRTIVRSGPPFHYPTNVAVSPAGDLYVADGYGNARIHKFAADGRLLFSWGDPGGGPGQFRIPHGVAVSRDGTVLVADRENSRIQLFDPGGRYLAEWTDVARPTQVFIDAVGDVYVSELGYRAGMWPGTTAPYVDAPGGRLSVFDRQGRLKARWGGGLNPSAAGDFFAPHDVCVDSHGSIYIGEVVWSAGASRGLISPDCHSLQKFTRRAER